MVVEQVAQRFLHQLDTGAFDGRVYDEVGKLSYEQLLRVSTILAERYRRAPVTAGVHDRKSGETVRARTKVETASVPIAPRLPPLDL
jgi:hypothetical protein